MTNHPTITIAPLSIPGAMSQAAWRCIQQADALFCRPIKAPAPGLCWMRGWPTAPWTTCTLPPRTSIS